MPDPNTPFFIAYGNVRDGHKFVGPWASRSDAEDYGLNGNAGIEDDWWVVQMEEPDRSIGAIDLDENELLNFETFVREQGFDANTRDVDKFDLTRDAWGTAWAASHDTPVVCDLTNGVTNDA